MKNLEIQKTLTISGAKYTGKEILKLDRYETNGGDWIVETNGGELIYRQYDDFIAIRNHGVVHRGAGYGDTVALLFI